MKIAILGAGAIGSYLGAMLQERHPGSEVVLIVRGTHGDEILRRKGVTVEEGRRAREVAVRASTDAAEVAGSDFILVTVKSQDTERALASAVPYWGEAIVVSMQNGINDATFDRYVPASRRVMGMTAVNLSIPRPGVVRMQRRGIWLVGPDRQRSNEPAAQATYALLRTSGIPFAWHENMTGAQYRKLAMNALGCASSLSGLNLITDAMLDRDWRDYVGRPLMKECRHVLTSAGITPARVRGCPDISRLLRIWKCLDLPMVGSMMDWGVRVLHGREKILFSLYQDLVRGKPTEVDFINGEFVRLAAEHAADAPYNTLVCELVHRLEAAGPGRLLPREECIAEFRALSASTVPAPEGVC